MSSLRKGGVGAELWGSPETEKAFPVAAGPYLLGAGDGADLTSAPEPLILARALTLVVRVREGRQELQQEALC